MKNSLALALALVSAAPAFAYGYRCEGEGLRAKLYNEVKPENGVHNPSVLIVSSQAGGTILVLKGEEMNVSKTRETILVEGVKNQYQTGRFTSASLEISKDADEEGLYAASLTIKGDGESKTADMTCTKYLKH